MAYLIEIAFDNSDRLRRNCYLFEYESTRFKLVQDNPRRWADHLLSIAPSGDEVNREAVFRAASEFLSALAWESGARIAVWEAGGRSMGQNISIRRVRPFTYVFPKIPFGGSTTGYDLPRTIPHIRTSEQRIALSLFREARASNNDYLSFLFLWQVLEVKGAQAVGFIDKIFRKHRHKLHLDPSYISRLPLAGRTLGSYLQENFRHAIAHIKRKPGKRPLEIDVLSERRNLAISTLVVEAFAEYFIREELSLGELSLARRRNGGIPVYADSSRIVTDRMIPARWPSTLPVRKKVSRSRKRA